MKWLQIAPLAGGLAFGAGIALLYGKRRVQFVLATCKSRYSERLDRSRQLHDFLIQSFQGITLQIQAAMESLPASPALKGEVEKTLSCADELLAQGRERAKEFCDSITFRREDNKISLE